MVVNGLITETTDKIMGLVRAKYSPWRKLFGADDADLYHRVDMVMAVAMHEVVSKKQV
jgi:hypothetical protein